ncbi:uncharacterized protein [Rutidosis leptorrhynchoides]|uniref:uncharacterized protein n=1 Tax=Rutidosis leptorrhynchoides TaxID=125765 RepID=UPI003A996B04
MADVVEITPLNLITQERDDWKVRVKVINQWSKTAYMKPESIFSYEFVLVDFQGHKMRASIYKNLMPFFAHTFKEGGFVDLSTFELKLNDDDWKLADHDLKICFLRKTTVRRCPPFKILRDVFNCVAYKDVQDWVLPKDSVFGKRYIVGQLVKLNRYKVDKDDNGEKKSIEFELSDASGEKVRCKLWGAHAEKLHDTLLSEYKKDEPVILMLHNCRYKDWEGPQVNNLLWGFKLFLNEPIQPIEEFKDALATAIREDDKYVKPVVEVDLGKDESSALTKFTDQENNKAYIIDDVRLFEKVCTFVVRGRVSSFAEKEGWFQYYCGTCDKKVQKTYDLEEMMYLYDCKVCNTTYKEANPKVRATIYVQDITGGCEMSLFDGQLSKMTHRSVQWLNNAAKNASDICDYPLELNKLLNKKFAFIVKHNLYGDENKLSGYTISDSTDNASVLNKLDAILKDKEAEYSAFDEDILVSSTPDVKKIPKFEDSGVASSCSTSTTPSSIGVKRPSPSQSTKDETPTGGTTSALGDLKIPKMEKL